MNSTEIIGLIVLPTIFCIMGYFFNNSAKNITTVSQYRIFMNGRVVLTVIGFGITANIVSIVLGYF